MVGFTVLVMVFRIGFLVFALKISGFSVLVSAAFSVFFLFEHPFFGFHVSKKTVFRFCFFACLVSKLPFSPRPIRIGLRVPSR